MMTMMMMRVRLIKLAYSKQGRHQQAY